MKRPSRVKVGPFWFDIEYMERVADPDNDLKNISGHTSQRTQKILVAVAKDAHEDFVRHTIWHEIKHAIIGITTDKDGTDDVEETLIQRLSAMEIGVMRENPKLMKYLIGGSDVTCTSPG